MEVDGKVMPELQGYQTLLGAFLGFAGVISTMLWNARLARQADERKVTNEILAEDRRRDHDGQVLRIVLEGELRHIISDCISNLALLDQSRTSFTFSLTDLSQIYKANVGRLGLLSSEEVENIVSAYVSLSTRDSILVNLMTVNKNDDASGPTAASNIGALAVALNPQTRGIITEMYRDISTLAQKAIDSISARRLERTAKGTKVQKVSR